MQISTTDEVHQSGKDLYSEYHKVDPYTRWFKQPHTVFGLALGIVFLIYFAFTEDNRGVESNVKTGILAACGIFLLFSTIQMRDGLLVRPHPAIWRLVMGMAVLYLLFLVFLLFQHVDHARHLMKIIDPALGKPLPERSYATYCDLYTPHEPTSSFKHLMDTVHDEFMLAHLLGWFGKGLLFRDVWLGWIMSILFELLEMTFEHMLPNFAECWWDHILLDIFLCNGLGLWAGLKVAKWLSIKPYNWIAQEIRPQMEEYHWEVLSSPKKLVGVIVLIIVFSLVELNAFFLKFVLWIPPPHYMNICRLLLWWSIGLPGMREYYQFLTDPKTKRMGTSAWLCGAIAGLELLICLKFGRGMFPNPPAPEVVWSWTIGATLFVLWAVWYFTWRKPHLDKNTPKTLVKSSSSNHVPQKKKQ